jgi:hypothetical protein
VSALFLPYLGCKIIGMPRIKEDRARTEVTIDGIRLSGWIDRVPCNVCGTRRVYHEQFDAYFCADCNEWKEPRCSDPACRYCPSRPERPLSDGKAP